VCQVAATPAARAWWGAGVEALADAAALPLRFEIDRFRLAADRWRREHGWAAEPLDSLERWRTLELAALRARADAMAALTGDPPDEAWLASRLRWFDQVNLHTNQIWVRAHGR
jgi:aminoglycoside phosphotransferase (APT) family kinase protein